MSGGLEEIYVEFKGYVKAILGALLIRFALQVFSESFEKVFTETYVDFKDYLRLTLVYLLIKFALKVFKNRKEKKEIESLKKQF